MESGPRFAPRCAWQFRQFHPWTDPGCDSRKPSAECEFFRFLSLLILANPSRLSGKKELAANRKPHFFPNVLRDDLADGACAYRVAAFANREAQALFHRHRRDQLNYQAN